MVCLNLIGVQELHSKNFTKYKLFTNHVLISQESKNFTPRTSPSTNCSPTMSYCDLVGVQGSTHGTSLSTNCSLNMSEFHIGVQSSTHETSLSTNCSPTMSYCDLIGVQGSTHGTLLGTNCTPTLSYTYSIFTNCTSTQSHTYLYKLYTYSIFCTRNH